VYFISDNGQTSTITPSAGSFNGGIQRQKIGLKGDIIG
jgi:hypothetical protein